MQPRAFAPGKERPRRALSQVTRAVELCPAEPEYRWRRSALWKRKGEEGRAGADIEEAVRLDPNYRRIERIRAGADILRTAVWKDEPPVGSCIVPCPAYCCHFSHGLIIHGVSLGPWKLRAIRLFMAERNIDENDFLARLPFNEKPHYAMMIPPNFVMKNKAGKSSSFPGAGRGTLGKRLFRDLPRGIDYGPISWITQKAKPCIFLEKGRCSIHDLGDEPALPSCKEFFCLTRSSSSPSPVLA